MNIPFLLRALKKRGTSQIDFAAACNQLNPATVSVLLRGALKPGYRLTARLIVGMKALRFTIAEIDQITLERHKTPEGGALTADS